MEGERQEGRERERREERRRMESKRRGNRLDVIFIVTKGLPLSTPVLLLSLMFTRESR